jgi:site-specific recombinase XerD
MAVSLSILIARFIEDRRESGIAEATLTTQGTWNRTYARWIGPAADLEDFNDARLCQFKSALESQGKRPRTIRSAILSLRAFGEWMVRQGFVPANPAKSVPMPKLDAARRKTASDKEVFALLDACDRLPDARRCALARAAVSILVYAGLRRGELLALKVGSVDVEEACVYVDCGKGSKHRTVYLPPEAVKAIDTWLLLRGECRHSFLFDYDHTRRIGDQGLRTLLVEIRAAAGLKGSTYLLPHAFRHNYATRLMQAGADLESIKDNLGHSSIVTTAVYLHSSPEQRRKVAALAARPQPELPGPVPQEPDPLRYRPSRMDVRERQRRIPR